MSKASKKALKIAELLEAECHLASGKLAETPSSFTQRVKEGDYSKAEGIAFMEGDKVQQIRSLISAGAIQEAQAILSQTSEMTKQELLFEQARSLCFNAKFVECQQILQNLIDDPDLNPLSRMTGYQLMSLCEFEIGDISKCLASINRVFAMETIYPRAEASLFARSLRIRALSMASSTFQVKHGLKDLWEIIASGRFYLNVKFQIIIYLLTECFIEKSPARLAVMASAGMKLAQKLASPLHEGIFLNYLASVCPEVDGDAILMAKQYPMVASSREKTLSRTMDKTPFNQPLEINDIIFLSHKSRYSFKADELHAFDLSPQNEAILTLLSSGPLEKHILFKKHWGMEFNPIVHDTKIRTSLKRIRQQTDLEIVSQDNLLHLPHTLIIP
ncbi:MAG: hypothetical protein ACOYL6_06245 [Bacteriovoracaceae bacterium]